jgi:RHS repeat-associated protein
MRPATLAYDLAGRVVDASVGIYDFAYAYDGLQNMVARTIDAPIGAPLPRVETGVYVYGSGSGPRQLARVESAGGQVSRSYDRDDAGRLVAIHDAAQTTLIDYDAFDRQRRVSLAGGLELEYAYGADGERITSFAPGVDDAAPLLDAQGIAVPAATPGASFGALRFGADASLEKGRLDVYVRLGERPLARVVVDVINASAPAELTYLHTTFGPGPTLITAPDGQVLEERFFEPFGALLLANRPDLSDPQTPGLIADSDAATAFSREAMGWLNKPHDPRTGWSDHGARWMAPEIGQWMTPDPPVKGPDPAFMERPWDLHPYQYVRSNPVGYWDPDGRVVEGTQAEQVTMKALVSIGQSLPRPSPEFVAAAVAVGETALGFVPVVGTLLDLKDIVSAGVDVYKGKAGAKEALAISILALVPGGDAIKGGKRAEKALEAGSEVAEATAQTSRRSSRASKGVGGGGGKRFSDEKQALVDMAKGDKRTGITPDDMQAYKDLNKELPDPFPPNQVRGPEVHPNRPHGKEPHGHVGPVDHIPIRDP